MYKFNGVGKVVNMVPIKNKHEFRPTNDSALEIRESLSFADNCMKNRVWLRGDTYELQQLYLKLRAAKKRNCFWGETTGQSYDVKRIHSGLPSRMVKSMSYVVLGDMRDIKFPNDIDTEVWKQIAKENRFNHLMDYGLKEVLAVGDGAFKVSIESLFSQYPIVEFYPAEMVEFVRYRGRIQEVIFSTKYNHGKHTYILKERYGYGYIINTLYLDGKEVPITSVPELAKVKDFYFAGGDGEFGEVKQKGDMMLAVPFILYSSSKYEGRGESIFDERETMFAALDRDVSQWDESVEAGAPITGISRKNLRYDPNTGKAIIPEALTRYVVLEGAGNGDGNSNGLGIQTIQYDIPWQSYYETHASFLDSILMGFMSPATLGIGIGKIDSGESQREKEKMTMYTRNYIVEALTEIVRDLAMIAVQAYYDYHEINSLVSEPDINFGDYANPAFEAVVETVTKAKQGGVMSIKTAVDELYGDSKTEEWKEAEVERIVADMGYTSLSEPSFGGDVNYGFEGEPLEDEPEPEDEEIPAEDE